ncbi:MAG: M23 family metallopeptidase [Oscillospiraceae bacterium]|nr:M23 family metallopeptidase [Oscillospiraceae bacterium]
MKQPFKTRFHHFFAGQGFYIVLFLCVTAIGISGYLLFAGHSSAGGDSLAAGGQTELIITPAPSPVPSSGPAPSAAPTPAPTPSAAPKAAPASPVPTASAPPDVPTAAEANAAFVRPLTGETITAFSADDLIYNETFMDWRTHEGMDIKAPAGETVMAITAGTVSDIYDDDLMGTTVVISHVNDLTGIYSNLSPSVSVSKGDTVQAGDAIGTVGETAIAEIETPSHLHFALQKAGSFVNPDDYLPDWDE